MKDWERWFGRVFVAIWTILVLVLGTNFLVQAFAAGSMSAFVFGLAVFCFMLFFGVRSFRKMR